MLSADRVFHALGDPTRRLIVKRLSKGPMAASQLATPLKITLTAVVQHLRVLEKSGLVETEKEGRVRTCKLRTAGFAPVERWMEDCRTQWERRLDRLGDVLGEG